MNSVRNDCTTTTTTTGESNDAPVHVMKAYEGREV